MGRYDRAAGERAVFTEFARVAGLRIRLGSIESRPSPEPDIRCEVIGAGPIAFELGGAVNPSVEQVTNEGENVRLRFKKEYESLAANDREAIERCLDGHAPAVFAGIRPDVARRCWRQTPEPILKMLCDMAKASEQRYRLREGDLRFTRVPVLKDLLTDLSVEPSNGNEPFLSVWEPMAAIDITSDLLRKKFESRYETDAPIELLVYYVYPRSRDALSWSEVGAFVAAELRRSPFRRVWFYECFSDVVTLVHPPPD